MRLEDAERAKARHFGERGARRFPSPLALRSQAAAALPRAFLGRVHRIDGVALDANRARLAAKRRAPPSLGHGYSHERDRSAQGGKLTLGFPYLSPMFAFARTSSNRSRGIRLSRCPELPITERRKPLRGNMIASRKPLFVGCFAAAAAASFGGQRNLVKSPPPPPPALL
jgi:hypothetical protein